MREDQGRSAAVRLQRLPPNWYMYVHIATSKIIHQLCKVTLNVQQDAQTDPGRFELVADQGLVFEFNNINANTRPSLT